MLNADVIDLYARTSLGAKVVVLSGGQYAGPSAAASTTGMSTGPAGTRPRR
jgi:hypothetical protein